MFLLTTTVLVDDNLSHSTNVTWSLIVHRHCAILLIGIILSLPACNAYRYNSDSHPWAPTGLDSERGLFSKITSSNLFAANPSGKIRHVSGVAGSFALAVATPMVLLTPLSALSLTAGLGIVSIGYAGSLGIEGLAEYSYNQWILANAPQHIKDALNQPTNFRTIYALRQAGVTTNGIYQYVRQYPFGCPLSFAEIKRLLESGFTQDFILYTDYIYGTDYLAETRGNSIGLWWDWAWRDRHRERVSAHTVINIRTPVTPDEFIGLLDYGYPEYVIIAMLHRRGVTGSLSQQQTDHLMSLGFGDFISNDFKRANEIAFRTRSRGDENPIDLEGSSNATVVGNVEAINR